jgi:choline-glycine betaine transporter
MPLTALISTGLIYTGWIDKEATPEEITSIQNVIIWVVTIISTISVISGLRGAIQLISLVAVTIGCVLTGFIFLADDTKYILNLQVQEIGYFFQTSIFQLNFWTDAFGQLRPGEGRAVDGKAAEQWWMEYVDPASCGRLEHWKNRFSHCRFLYF